jgi:NodT family efflux transporter outer membrane factor (OMF) lipoprotein
LTPSAATFILNQGKTERFSFGARALKFFEEACARAAYLGSRPAIAARGPRARQSGRFLGVAGAIVLSTSGCMVGPDFLEPTAPTVAGYTAINPSATVATDAPVGSSQTLHRGKDVGGAWWRLFRSKEIDALVAEAVRNHPDLAAAQAALRQARETTLAEGGALLPQASTSDSVTPQRTSAAEFDQNGPATNYTLYNVSVPISYTPDFFGGTRRHIESDQAAAEYERFELEATYLALTANVITAAISDASYAAQIKVTGELIALQRKQLDLLQGQFALGAVGQADVLSQKAQLAQTVAALPPLQKARAQNRNQLMAYLGRLPSQDHDEAVSLEGLHLPSALPLTLPSRLVRQRPDIRAAEEQLHEASANVGVAIANMLPSVTLSASSGSQALAVAQLFGPQTTVASFEASVTQSLFDGGTLYHKKEAEKAAYDQAAAKYRSTVITAFQNVADSLAAIKADAALLKAQVDAEKSARASFAISTAQFQAGSTTYTTVLNAEQTLLNASTSRVKAQAARLSDTAALFQALGGGWWNRVDETLDAAPRPSDATALSPLAAALADPETKGGKETVR